MKLIIETQILENYGDPEKPFWKAKGGNTYHVTGVPLNRDYRSIVDAAGVECDNRMLREYIIDWYLEGDDFISESEKYQLEVEGELRFPDPRIEYSELVESV